MSHMSHPQVQCQPPQTWRPDGVLAAGSSAALCGMVLGPYTHHCRPQSSYTGLHQRIVSMLMDSLMQSQLCSAASAPGDHADPKSGRLHSSEGEMCQKSLCEIARGRGGHCIMLRHALPRMLASISCSILNATACLKFQPSPHEFLPVIASVSPSAACQAARVPAIRQAPGQP